MSGPPSMFRPRGPNDRVDVGGVVCNAERVTANLLVLHVDDDSAADDLLRVEGLVLEDRVIQLSFENELECVIDTNAIVAGTVVVGVVVVAEHPFGFLRQQVCRKSEN